MQEKSTRGPLLFPTRSNCRYGKAARGGGGGEENQFSGSGPPNLSQPSRSIDTRYPFGILFNLSLSLYRIFWARRPTEKRSLFFIPLGRARARANCMCVYFSPGYGRGDFSRVVAARSFLAVRSEQSFARARVGRSVLRPKSPPLSFAKEMLDSFFVVRAT